MASRLKPHVMALLDMMMYILSGSNAPEARAPCAAAAAAAAAAGGVPGVRTRVPPFTSGWAAAAAEGGDAAASSGGWKTKLKSTMSTYVMKLLTPMYRSGAFTSCRPLL